MHYPLTLLLATALGASALALGKRNHNDSCQSYTLLNTRGTDEAPGESKAFSSMNANITSLLPGGKIYNTVYPATFTDYMASKAAGTRDILRYIRATLDANPKECFVLQGYSQGASATVSALAELKGEEREAVKGVFLLGDPQHTAGLACNVDNLNGMSTRNANGISAAEGRVPDDWIGRTLDVCMHGDSICDPGNAAFPLINAEHLSYLNDAPTQSLGSWFALYHLGSSVY
ncbi:cutinase 1 [Teratosphaeria destructans]|uniref:Cutinase 1 n=1 Tax=Teratosphaeria destructans TaxID=418781 RepID=A0A9W7VY14_9PEZI|nr:cutinase 1 [Teratosphaeria destructans]